MIPLHMYPYTNFSELNLDFILKDVGDLSGLKLRYHDNSIELVDRTGKILSVLPFANNTGNIIPVDIYNLIDADHSTFVHELISMDVDEQLIWKSDMQLADMIELIRNGNLISLRHHKYWNGTDINNIDICLFLDKSTLYIDPSTPGYSYITFQYIWHDYTVSQNIHIMSFEIHPGDSDSIYIKKISDWTDAEGT